MNGWTFSQILAISCIPVAVVGLVYFVATHLAG